MGTIIWREEWKRPYESIWSVIENIKISNSINGSDLMHYLNENTTDKTRSVRNVNKLSEEALDKLKKLTNIDFLEIKTTMLKLSKLTRSYHIKPHLRRQLPFHLHTVGKQIRWRWQAKQ